MRKSFIIAFAILCIGIGQPAFAASDANFQATQTIKPFNCTLTELHNGSGTAVDSDCPAQPPQIENITIVNDKPILYGKYDAAYSQSLRIRFNTFWYVLGVDPELRVSGNDWTLDLTTQPLELTPGIYTLTVEMTATNGQVLTTEVSFNIQKRAETTTPSGATNPSPSPATQPLKTYQPVATSVPNASLQGFKDVYISQVWKVQIGVAESTITKTPISQKYIWIPVVLSIASGIVAGIVVEEIIARRRAQSA